MTDKTLVTKGLRVSFPPAWTADQSGEELTLFRSEQGGAITISTYRHFDPQVQADALEKCRRFLTSRGVAPIHAQGSASDATAEFEDTDGVRWMVRTLAREQRFVLATYNSSGPGGANSAIDVEDAEMRRILTGIIWIA
jgi:hypothetical protein